MMVEDGMADVCGLGGELRGDAGSSEGESITLLE